MSAVTLSLLQVLAHHAGRKLSSIRPSHDLEADLNLTPLEVVLVALEVECAEDVNLDLEGLEEVKTVSELSAYLVRSVARARSRAAAA